MSLFRMPSLGSDMERATLIEWLVEPGATVHRGDLIAVVETDKGAIEIEVFEDGLLGTCLVELGDEVLVGAPLAEIISDTDTDTDTESVAATNEPSAATTETATATIRSSPPLPPDETPSPPAAAAPIPPVAAPTLHRISPAARHLAHIHNIDLTAVQGTGPDGVVVHADVQSVIDGGSPRGESQQPGSVAAFSPMRRAIGAAMTRAKREIPHYYLSQTVDVEDTVEWLATTNRGRAPGDRLLAIAPVLKAVALALREHADFNGLFEGGEYHPSEHVHLGVAIAIRGGGLVAPAIHDADKLSVEELMAQLKDLTQRVRAGRFRASELRDPSATVTSMGDRGVESVQGVIYPPQVACIGIGKIVDRPWSMPDRSVASRQTISVTLAADHRVSDGRSGARLLATIDKLLRHPDAL